jgi:hypothetical protein
MLLNFQAPNKPLKHSVQQRWDRADYGCNKISDQGADRVVGVLHRLVVELSLFVVSQLGPAPRDCQSWPRGVILAPQTRERRYHLEKHGRQGRRIAWVKTVSLLTLGVR